MDVRFEQSYNTPVSNSPLLPLLLLSLATQKNSPSTSIHIKDQYDFIIVGGGSAGSVVASRLSEDSDKTVLLLEAGHMPPVLTEVPGLASFFLGSDVDWKFKTVPQKHAAYGMKEEKIDFNAGKMLGGSSNVNGMLYVRGIPQNYDEWEAQGAEGWSYNDVLPYFFKLEDFRVPQYKWNGYHSMGGPITVEQPKYVSDLNTAFLAAITSSGSFPRDINADRHTGYFDMYGNIRNGQRCSPVKGYLVPAENRSNLDILLNALVTKVIIEGNRAKGVEYYYEGQFYVVGARKEVILSAGVVNSPKLLMLSGVGPRDQLQKFGIPVVADLPVGKNFHDHPGLLHYFTIQTASEPFDKKLGKPEYIQEYIWNRSGPLASQLSISYGVFSNGLTVDSPENVANAFSYIGEISIQPTISKYASMKPEVYKQFIKPYENDTICGCFLAAGQPKSRGTIELSSSNPFDPPLIDPNFLAVDTDLDELVDGIKVCNKILESIALRPLRAKPFETIIPGCERYIGFEDDYLRCYGRSLTTANYHGVGSCKMGDPNNSTTVLDPHLRVKNVKGLRVVDASVMPIIPTGNTNVPTIMVAEKASDIIKMDHLVKQYTDIF